MKLLLKPFFLYLTCVAFTVAIGLILFNPNADGYLRQGQYFVYKFIWFEFVLTALFWGGVYGPFRKMSTEKLGGAYPAMSIAVFNASLFSFFIILISSFFPNDEYIGVFIALQLLVILIAIIKVFLMSHASDLQSVGMEEIRNNIKNPQELCTQLAICERQPKLEPETLKLLRKVKDGIQYSLPRVGNIASSVKYERVVDDCDKICGLIMSGSYDNINVYLNNLNNFLTELTFSLKK
jgi:hypothetical protein